MASPVELGTKLRGYVQLIRDANGIDTQFPKKARPIIHALNPVLAIFLDRARFGEYEAGVSWVPLLQVNPDRTYWRELFGACGFRIFEPTPEEIDQGIGFFLSVWTGKTRRKYNPKVRAKPEPPPEPESAPEPAPEITPEVAPQVPE